MWSQRALRRMCQRGHSIAWSSRPSAYSELLRLRFGWQTGSQMKPEVASSLKKHGKHEALADIYESIAEMKHYRDNFLKL